MRTNFDENPALWTQKVEKIKKHKKQTNFDKNAAIWAQKVKTIQRNAPSGQILIKMQQCECEKSKKIKQT